MKIAIVLSCLFISITSYASERTDVINALADLASRRKSSYESAQNDLRVLNYVRMKLFATEEGLKELDKAASAIQPLCRGSDIQFASCKAELDALILNSRLRNGAVDLLVNSEEYKDLIRKPLISRIPLDRTVQDYRGLLLKVSESALALRESVGKASSKAVFKKNLDALDTYHREKEIETRCGLAPSRLKMTYSSAQADFLLAGIQANPYLAVRARSKAREVIDETLALRELCKENVGDLESRARGFLNQISESELYRLFQNACLKYPKLSNDIREHCRDTRPNELVFALMNREIAAQKVARK